MFLNEALTKLKNLKSKAARTEKYINESAIHYEDQTPEYDYETEMLSRLGLQEEIVVLKTAIQRTNALTLVRFNGQDMSLAELILRNSQLRVELAFLAKQMEHSTTETGHFVRGRTKEDIKKVFAKGCDKAHFKKEVDRVEKLKEELEAVMAGTNASTPLNVG